MKTTKLFFMAALALMTAACSNSDNDILNPAQPAKAEGITITATLAPKSSAGTRAVEEGKDGDSKDIIKATWAKNEHIAILYTVGSEKKVADAEITSVDGTTGVATITFGVDGSTVDGTACQIVYPYSAAKDDNSGVKDAATLLASQDGTLSTNLDVRVGAGTIQTTKPSLTVTTEPAAQFAIFKFDVKNADASAPISVKPLTITIGAQNYVITPADAKSTLYAALPAVSGQTVSFSATGSDSKTYVFSKDNVTFTAGKYYQSTVKMAPAAATPLDNTIKAWTAGSYAVPAGGLTYSDAITVSGDVTLTLTDGETLTLNKGISIADGATLTIQGNGTMNVNGTNESTASTVAGTGTLVLTSGTLTVKGGNGGSVGADEDEVTKSAGGIAINGAVTVSGGTLTATGGNGGAGGSGCDSKAGAGAAAISGDVTVSGGTLTATGGNGGSFSGSTLGPDGYAGAGGTAIGGSVTITDGTVTATGGNGGSITISNFGAELYAGNGGAAIGGNATLTGGTLNQTNGTNGTVGGSGNKIDCSAGTGGKAVAGNITNNGGTVN